MQEWIAIKVPFNIKAGDLVMFSARTGVLVPVLSPDAPTPAKEEKVITTKPLIIPDKIQTLEKKKVIQRPYATLLSDRDRTLSLIAQHPAGIPVLKIAEIIHARIPNTREKMLAADDVDYLVSKGVVVKFKVDNGTALGQACVKPA